MFGRFIISWFFSLLLLTACQENEQSKSYSFFVAGHCYGHPSDLSKGLHPPFKAKFSELNKNLSIKFGVLTGDVIARPKIEYWNAFRAELNLLKKPVHLAAGNHDRGAIFDSLYTPFYTFRENRDLFIILNPTNWNIEGEQKEFLEQLLVREAPNAQHIFIFCHELIWWSPENKFKNIEINYRPHYPGSCNYWEEIHPLLNALNKEVYIFAGDLGATNKVTPYMYYQEGAVHFIASGMGNGKEDNFIIVDVNQKSGVKIKLVGLNNQDPKMKNLKDFVLP